MKIITTFTLVIILSISFSNAQEFEVDGDLKVTGSVESTTIDSLNQVITSLQAQVDSIKANGNIASRVFTFNLETYTSAINMHEIIGYELDWFLLQIVEFSFPNGYSIISSWGVDWESQAALRNDGYSESEATQNIYSDPIVTFIYHNGGSESLNAPVTVLITAQFPN